VLACLFACLLAVLALLACLLALLACLLARLLGRFTPEQLLERVTKQKARGERHMAAAGKQEAESSRTRRFKQLTAICHRKQVVVQEVQDWLDVVKAELQADGMHAVDVDDAIGAVVNTRNKMSETLMFHLVRECGLDSSDGEVGFLGAFKLLLPYADVAIANLRGDTLLHAAYVRSSTRRSACVLAPSLHASRFTQPPLYSQPSCASRRPPAARTCCLFILCLRPPSESRVVC
jgi:hypothetical protein